MATSDRPTAAPFDVPRERDVPAAAPEGRGARDAKDQDGDDRDRDEPAASALGEGLEAPIAGLDPLERALYQPRLATFDTARAAPAPPPQAPAPPLELLVDRFVKRFAMSGDRHRGTAHLTVGAGELAGGSVTLHAEHGAVTIVVDAPPGADGSSLGERLRQRMKARGVEATVEVR